MSISNSNKILTNSLGIFLNHYNFLCLFILIEEEIKYENGRIICGLIYEIIDLALTQRMYKGILITSENLNI